MAKIDNICGRQFGKLTVVELMPERQDRYALYRCRCDCGNEIFANSKRLKRGSIQGCSECWSSREREALDLTGQKFGMLTVVRLSDERKYKRRTWLCQCDCGEYRNVTTHDLRSGYVSSCGCANSRSYPYKDLTWQKFGRLTVLGITDERSAKGSILWKCMCECGREKLFSEDYLVHGNGVSCGCYRETELARKLSENLHHVDGTCVEFLCRKKRADNTSGHTGVYITKNGKFRASITFKKKRYHLGIFDTVEDALKARKRGEEMHEDFLEKYYKMYPEQIEKKQNRLYKATENAE